jgi:hypothetical protein
MARSMFYAGGERGGRGEGAVTSHYSTEKQRPGELSAKWLTWQVRGLPYSTVPRGYPVYILHEKQRISQGRVQVQVPTPGQHPNHTRNLYPHPQVRCGVRPIFNRG